MYKLNTHVMKTITKVDAKSMLQRYNTFPAQRPISRRTISLYKKMMKTDKFRAASIVFANNNKNGTRILVDGQHRLVALSELKGISLVIFEEDYICENHREVVKLFSSFNTDLPRSIVDISFAHAELYGLMHLNRTVRQWVVQYASFYYIKSLAAKPAISLDERADLIKHHVKAASFLMNLFSLYMMKGENKAFKNANIAIPMLHSFEIYGEEISTSFWTSVLSESDIVDGFIMSPTDASRVFRRIIVRAYADRINGWWDSSTQGRKRMACTYQRAINHFIKNKEVASLPYRPNDVFIWEPGKSNKKKWA